MSEAQSTEKATRAGVEAQAAFARGGTLSDLVAHYQRLGSSAELTAGGTQSWVPGVRGEMQRFPLECTSEVDTAVSRTLLKKRGIWLVSYLLEGSGAVTPNCFDYVCTDSEYDIGKLGKNARRDIRRGLRRFLVRLCTTEELIEKGLPAHADTMERHGYTEPPADFVERLGERYRDTPFYEIWGAWQGERLCAWMTIIKIDDWAMIDIVRSCTDVLGDCPNNAVLYTATRRLLVAEKRRYVTYGLSSLQVNVNELSMHKYKIRMGYQAVPMHRKFVLHPFPKMILTTRPASWMVEALAGRVPRIAGLRKIAGLSRLLSGREKSPLAWADMDRGTVDD